ncbi:MAG: methylated-DNA--[protein]-cysteine S-methyltransferase [Azonexus sp.]|nr:methylated-DNA--[protein]-cysteine S-methyltransferase [Betaproteobacteria bacterium]MBK8919054.1 methylated-DNA--[protein]-cysteine S-methyltransferase [Betaproteobacteria bacterium]MBP6036723.1 methylated-DNA--[protein]-cysteine S-methyltransferase [Azonexus sp.]MBP6905506.1 methylated-DNA--[protein]-cysteine S-methyltransferase [Azonexus sp.]
MRGEEFGAVLSAPGFSLGVQCDEEEIFEIHFLEPCPEVAPISPLAAEAVRQLKAYLVAPGFVFGLPLRPSGTTFQRRVWEQIAAIPCGRTRTYGEVARSLNNAPRAVGQACGANPFPLVVPCHRVIGAAASLGGFARHGGGFLLDVKRWLLTHEGCLPGG